MLCSYRKKSGEKHLTAKHGLVPLSDSETFTKPGNPMTELAYIDFYDPKRDTDSTRRVVEIYRAQLPGLYGAAERGDIRTLKKEKTYLGGETLITYRSAIRRLFGKSFQYLVPTVQEEILAALESVSITSKKNVMCWDAKQRLVINNHQIGNMMPFPSGVPSINSFRADVIKDPGPGFTERERSLCRSRQTGSEGRLFDYFDRFLCEVERYYGHREGFEPVTALQVAIRYQHGYFDFFQTFDNYIEANLLQDFVGVSLWSIDNFQDYLETANRIIDERGARIARQLGIVKV